MRYRFIADTVVEAETLVAAIKVLMEEVAALRYSNVGKTSAWIKGMSLKQLDLQMELDFETPQRS